MNPFDLRGPQFLLFFWAFAAVVVATVDLLRRRMEGGEVPRLRAVDPYLVACLRGGQLEAIKVAVLSLIERNLLTTDGKTVTAVARARDQVTRELERQIVQAASSTIDARLLLMHGDILAATRSLADELVAQRLAPSARQIAARRWIGAGAFAIVSAVALIKLGVAFARGRHNVGFLWLSWAVTAVLLIVVLSRGQTGVGQRLLADLGTMFQALRARVGASEREPHELLLAWAVYGRRVVPGMDLGLFNESSGSASGSCGSSCGGGGGCGGGGCGGCGS